MTNFDTAFDRVISVEKGYVNDPDDPGGETSYGISKRAYPNEDIKGMTPERAKFLYKRDYWDPLMLDVLPFAIAFQLFDCAVNSGVNAAKTIMSGLNAKQSSGAMLCHVLAARLLIMTSSPRWSKFGKGWAIRIASDLELAVKDLA